LADDLKTGKELWSLKGGGDIPVPTPVFQDGLVVITNAHGKGRPIYAIRADAAGDMVTPTGLLRSANTNGASEAAKAFPARRNGKTPGTSTCGRPYSSKHTRFAPHLKRDRERARLRRQIGSPFDRALGHCTGC